MTKYHNIILSATAVPSNDDFVSLDGVKLRGVQEVDIKVAYNHVATVTITMIANINANIDNAEVKTDDSR